MCTVSTTMSMMSQWYSNAVCPETDDALYAKNRALLDAYNPRTQKEITKARIKLTLYRILGKKYWIW